MNVTGAAVGSDAHLAAEQQTPPDGDSTESHITEIGAAGIDAEDTPEEQSACPVDDYSF